MGVVVLGFVAPGVGAVALVGVLVAGNDVDGVAAVGVVVVTAAAVVTVAVEGVGAGPVSPASVTSAAASTPSERTITAITAVIGAFQLGEAASLVRAAAPQRRHHSWSGASGARHNGHASPACGVGAGEPEAIAAGGPWPSAGGLVALTVQALPDAGSRSIRLPPARG